MYWLSRRRPGPTADFGCLLGCAVMTLSAMVTVAGVILLIGALFRALMRSS
jgi:threonine/homoserine/homoserine lactone efflux protein